MWSHVSLMSRQPHSCHHNLSLWTHPTRSLGVTWAILAPLLPTRNSRHSLFSGGVCEANSNRDDEHEFRGSRGVQFRPPPQFLSRDEHVLGLEVTDSNRDDEQPRMCHFRPIIWGTETTSKPGWGRVGSLFYRNSGQLGGVTDPQLGGGRPPTRAGVTWTGWLGHPGWGQLGPPIPGLGVTWEGCLGGGWEGAGRGVYPCFLGVSGVDSVLWPARAPPQPGSRV